MGWMHRRLSCLATDAARAMASILFPVIKPDVKYFRSCIVAAGSKSWDGALAINKLPGDQGHGDHKLCKLCTRC